MKKHWYKVCPRCHQGRLFIMKYDGRSDLFLLCEECEWAYERPEYATSTKNGFLGIDVDCAFASEDMIEQAGWDEYALEAAEA